MVRGAAPELFHEQWLVSGSSFCTVAMVASVWKFLRHGRSTQPFRQAPWTPGYALILPPWLTASPTQSVAVLCVLQAEGNVALAFGLVIAAGACTCLGALLVFCSNLANPKWLSGSLGASAGVMM